MVSENYEKNWQKANQWLRENAPDWVMEVLFEAFVTMSQSIDQLVKIRDDAIREVGKEQALRLISEDNIRECYDILSCLKIPASQTLKSESLHEAGTPSGNALVEWHTSFDTLHKLLEWIDRYESGME